MIIKVTAADIKKGRPHITSNDCCPVALAMRRAGLKKATVGVFDYAFKGKTYDLPWPAVRFIIDMTGVTYYSSPAKPFSFRIARPKA